MARKVWRLRAYPFNIENYPVFLSGFPPSGKNTENDKSIFQTWKNQGIWKKGQNQGIWKYLVEKSGKKFSVPHTLYPSCDGAVHEFCLIVGGESVAVRAAMGATFKNKNHVFLVGDWSFLLHVNAEKFCKNLGKIREFDSGNPVGTLLCTCI